MKNYHLLLETYSLTAYFRSLIDISHSHEIRDFLLNNSHLDEYELQHRWDNFDKIFWKEYWNKISALSFATIIEARWKLLNSILKGKSDNLVIELASWFTPRWLNLVNSQWLHYIETDKKEVIKLKKEFYKYLWSLDKKTPKIKVLDVLNTDDFKNIYDNIKLEKLKDDSIKEVTLISEWLLIYLRKNEQKIFFDNMREFSKLLNNIWIKLVYITTDMPTHENFTNWLVNEGFNLKDHLEVMAKVDPKIIESLFNTENDFLVSNSLWTIEKFYYSEEMITSLKTPKLTKYKKIPEIKEKINSFLKQEILFAWEKEF